MIYYENTNVSKMRQDFEPEDPVPETLGQKN